MRVTVCSLLLAVLFGVSAPAHSADRAETTLLVAAAASLQYSYEELIPLFQNRHPGIIVEGTYDSSGKLQSQIENGLEADVFMSAAMKQMDALMDSGAVEADSIVELLENRIVLIKPAGSKTNVADFTDVLEAGVVAVGDPASVPAGQYAREAFINLGLWDELKDRASFGTNVTEVLNWVAEGSADVGVVYATDAAASSQVEVVAEAPAGSLKQRVLYPVGILSASRHSREARLFVDFLSSGEGLAIFAKHGFTPNR